MGIGFEEVYPLWALSTPQAGGLGWGTEDIGKVGFSLRYMTLFEVARSRRILSDSSRVPLRYLPRLTPSRKDCLQGQGFWP